MRFVVFLVIPLLVMALYGLFPIVLQPSQYLAVKVEYGEIRIGYRYAPGFRVTIINNSPWPVELSWIGFKVNTLLFAPYNQQPSLYPMQINPESMKGVSVRPFGNWSIGFQSFCPAWADYCTAPDAVILTVEIDTITMNWYTGHIMQEFTLRLV